MTPEFVRHEMVRRERGQRRNHLSRSLLARTDESRRERSAGLEAFSSMSSVLNLFFIPVLYVILKTVLVSFSKKKAAATPQLEVAYSRQEKSGD